MFQTRIKIVLSLAAVFLSTAAADLVRLDPEDFEWDNDISGLELAGQMNERLVHGGFQNWRIHAASTRDLISIRDQLDFALPVLNGWMGGMLPDNASFVIFSITEPSLWRDLLAGIGGHEDGLGFMKGRRIGFLNPEGVNDFGFELFHELIHLYVAEVYGERFPLWAEEGIAQHFAWRLSSAYAKAEKGIPLRRVYPDLNKPYRFRKVLKVRSYPDDPKKLRSFYFCSEQLMATLTGFLAEDQYRLLWPQLAENPSDLKGIMRRLYYWDQSDWKRFQNRYTSKIMNTKNSSESNK